MPQKKKTARKRTARKAKPSLKSLKHPPPPDLPERAKEIWIEVTEPLPKDHFYQSDLPLLREYCRVTADIEQTREEWDGSRTTIKANGDLAIHPLMTLLDRMQTKMAQLAGKLRVCPSARLSKEKAGFEKPKPKSKRAHLL